jgi:G:T-mismatch repair DNA endonuclease (very short patch repair protein)
MLGITDANRQITLVINSKNVRVDGFNPDTNTVYEFYGDYWHGNINKYDAKRINQSTNTTFEQLFTKTVEREKLIKSAGYNLVTMWESDFKKSKI